VPPDVARLPRRSERHLVRLDVRLTDGGAEDLDPSAQRDTCATRALQTFRALAQSPKRASASGRLQQSSTGEHRVKNPVPYYQAQMSARCFSDRI
jgi:hypothetical protein